MIDSTLYINITPRNLVFSGYIIYTNGSAPIHFTNEDCNIVDGCLQYEATIGYTASVKATIVIHAYNHDYVYEWAAGDSDTVIITLPDNENLYAWKELQGMYVRYSTEDVISGLEGTLVDILVNSNGYPVMYNGKVVALVLPDIYTRVPYLESTGTQYINTGFIPTEDFKHTIVFSAINGTNSTRYICGTGVSEGRSGNLRITNSTLDGLYINKSSAKNILTATQSIQLNTIYTVVMDLHNNAQNYATLNGTSIASTSTGTITSTNPLYLWALSGSYLPTGIRIYSSKVNTANRCVQYFIPARRNSDSVLGMYDLIQNRFLTNAGSGSFITAE